MKRTVRTYTELLLLSSYEERLRYLLVPFQDVFGVLRYLNQQFYASGEWRRVRSEVIARDNGCDLALPGRAVCGELVAHHMVPIMPDDFTSIPSGYLLDPMFLVTCSRHTHELIHGRGREALLIPSGDRMPGDTRLW